VKRLRGELRAWIALCALVLGARALAADALPQPFTAEYSIEWMGLRAGTSQLTFAQAPDSHYSYTSRINARGLFRLVFPDEISQASTFTIDASGLPVPLSYRSTDGSSDKKRDVTLDFNWTTERVTGIAEKQPVDVPLRPGTQDAMSVQIAMLRGVAADQTPKTYLMIEKNEITDYIYAPEGTAHLTTALGDIDTVIWTSRRPNSDKVTRLWCAPSLGYVPVRAERKRGSKTEWLMNIRSFKR
jgi:hypothetical protein